MNSNDCNVNGFRLINVIGRKVELEYMGVRVEAYITSVIDNKEKTITDKIKDILTNLKKGSRYYFVLGDSIIHFEGKEIVKGIKTYSEFDVRRNIERWFSLSDRLEIKELLPFNILLETLSKNLHVEHYLEAYKDNKHRKCKKDIIINVRPLIYVLYKHLGCSTIKLMELFNKKDHAVFLYHIGVYDFEKDRIDKKTYEKVLSNVKNILLGNIC